MEADESLRGQDVQCPACGTSFIAPEISVAPGLVIDGYKIVRRLGVGGMGEVWLARQQTLERDVAIKILSPKFTRDQDFVSRFMQEVKMVGRVSHPNMITAYSAGTDKGVKYLAVEYVDGVELSNRMRVDHHFPEKQALQIGRKVAEALNYAWTKFKILHRDIKPENIMIDAEGEPKIMDLGISKSMAEDNSLTMTGMVIGTPYYMSPEQARADKRMDCRVDIYSLGATLFHMLSGQVPYDGPTAMAIISKHMAPSPVPSVREFNNDVSPECAALLKTMMAKDPDKRQKDWNAVIRDIDLVLEGSYPSIDGVEGQDAESSSASPVNDPAGPSKSGSGLFRNAIALAVLACAVFGAYEVFKSKGYLSQREAQGSSPAPFISGSESARATPAPKAKEKETQEKPEPGTVLAEVSSKAEEDWNHAKSVVEDSLNTNSGFDVALRELERLASSKEGPKLAELINDAKAKLLKARALDGLVKKAAEFAASGDPGAAAFLLKDYSGEFKEETSEIRLKLAAQYEDAAKAKTKALEEAAKAKAQEDGSLREQRKKRLRETAGGQSKKSVDAVAGVAIEKIFEGDTSGALAEFESACEENWPDQERDSLEQMRGECAELNAAEKELLKRLKEDIGRNELEIQVFRGNGMRFNVQAVNDGKVTLSSVNGGATIVVRPIFIEPRLWVDASKCGPQIKNLLRGCFTARLGAVEPATRFFENAGPLGDELIAVMTKRIGQRSQPFGGIPREPQQGGSSQGDSAKGTGGATPPSNIPQPPKEAAKEAPKEPKDIRQALKGKIVKFDPKTLAIEIRYDFSDARQLEDWTPMQLPLPGAPQDETRAPFAQNGKLIVDAQGSFSFQALKPRFDSIDSIKSTLTFRGNGAMQGLGLMERGQQSLLFLCASGLVPNDAPRDSYIRIGAGYPRPLQDRVSEAKQDRRTELELSWKDSKANFAINKRSFGIIPFEQKDGCVFWIGAVRAKDEYSEIFVKGRLNKDWYESECGGAP